MAAKDKFTLCRNILSDLFPKITEKHFPESILPIAVIKIDRTALDRGKTSQYEQFTVCIKNRLKTIYSV